MAEYLVFASNNWMDELPIDDLKWRLNWEPGFRAKYSARNVPGDIIKVYPDGTCKEKPSPNSKMVIIKIPGMAVDKSLEDSQIDKSGEVVKSIAKCKHRIDLSSMQLIDKMATLSESTALNLIIDKSI